MASPTPFPPAAPQPSPAGTGMESYADMMGVQNQSPSQDIERMRQQQIQSVASQIRQVGEALDGIAKQFPAAGQEILALKAGLTRVLVKIVGSSSPGSQSPTGDMG